MKKEKQKIDYYGDKDNYIHLKFGDCRENYNFTNEFITEYPLFIEHYTKYFSYNDKSQFKNAFQVITYIYNEKIPVDLYYNFTNTPVQNEEEVMQYLLKKNNIKKLYD